MVQTESTLAHPNIRQQLIEIASEFTLKQILSENKPRKRKHLRGNISNMHSLMVCLTRPLVRLRIVQTELVLMYPQFGRICREIASEFSFC